jgi:hypothetical protein
MHVYRYAVSLGSEAEFLHHPSPQPLSTPVLHECATITAAHHRHTSSPRIVITHHRRASSPCIIVAHHRRAASSRFLACMPYTCSVHVSSITAYVWDDAFFGGFAAALAALAVGDQLTERIRDGDQARRPVICRETRATGARDTKERRSESAERTSAGVLLACVVGI